MINLDSSRNFYIILFCFIPLFLRGLNQYIDNFWLALCANIISLLLIFLSYSIFRFGLKTNSNNDKRLRMLAASIITLFWVVYLTYTIFSDNVIFVGGKYFSYVIYSYLIYFYLFIQFWVIFVFRFYYHFKK